MSHPDLLSEDEVADYINQKFGLKVDRDIFIKPHKDVIADLYLKFLDTFHADRWPIFTKQPKSTHEFSPTISAAGPLKFIFSRYNTPYEFLITDLIKPVRKRTLAFFNVLIFFTEQLQEKVREYESKKQIYDADLQKSQEAARMVADRRLRLEELRIAIANRIPTETLRRKVNEERDKFEARSRECDRMGEQTKATKEQIKNLEEETQVKLAKSQEYDQELAVLDKDLKILHEGSMVQKRKNTLQCSIRELELELKKVHELADKKTRKIKDTSSFATNMMYPVIATLEARADRDQKLNTQIHRAKQEKLAQLDQAEIFVQKLIAEKEELENLLKKMREKLQQKKVQAKCTEEVLKLKIEKKKSQLLQFNHESSKNLEAKKLKLDSLISDNASLETQEQTNQVTHDAFLRKEMKQTEKVMEKLESLRHQRIQHDFDDEINRILGFSNVGVINATYCV